jgi:hypothetical protein
MTWSILVPTNMKPPLLAFALVVLIAPSLAAGEPVPSRVEVKYRLHIAGILIGEGLGVFQQDGKAYSVVMESRTIGIAAIYGLHIRSEAGVMSHPRACAR